MSMALLAPGTITWAAQTEAEDAASAQTESEAGSAAYDSEVTDLLEKMTLREKIAQMFVPCVRTWYDENTQYESQDQQNSIEAMGLKGLPFTAMNDDVKKMLSEERFGGVLLYGENCEAGNAQVLQLVNDMQAANQETDSECVIPLLICMDQEGGVVARLTEGVRGVGNMALSATSEAYNIADEASVIAKELQSVGVNVTFAPDVDVNNNPANPVIGVRSFSDDPAVVSEDSIVFMDALSEAGLITSPKHFPGHGNTSTDSHTGLPMVDKSYEELKECELIPFQAVIDAGAEMIMSAHIQYPQVETETSTSTSSGEEIYVPATLSHTIMTDVLRGDMGFDGVIVSDSLSMDAIVDNFGLEDACARAINAGVNIILTPITIYDAETMQQMTDLVDDMVNRTESGEISEETVDDSVAHILTLKKNHDLLDPINTELTQEQIDAAGDTESLKKDMEVIWDHACKAITLVKNDDNVLPVKAKEDESVLFVYTASSRLYTADMVMERLKRCNVVPESLKYQAIQATADTEQECIEAAKNADHVFLITSLFGVSGFDPTTDSGITSKVFDEVIDAAHDAGHKVVLVSGVLPYDAARYQKADGILLSYGSTARTSVPTEVTAYIPNLVVAMCTAFGEYEPVGKLPVVIPTLDENYAFTDEPLYERGYSLSYANE